MQVVALRSGGSGVGVFAGGGGDEGSRRAAAGVIANLAVGVALHKLNPVHP
jgi:hypothetical protein